MAVVVWVRCMWFMQYSVVWAYLAFEFEGVFLSIVRLGISILPYQCRGLSKEALYLLIW